MVKKILILFLAVMQAEANELNGSFENGTYVSPSGIFSCNWHSEKLIVDIDSISDNYNEKKTELVKFSSSKSGSYINYWYSLSPKTTVLTQDERKAATEDANLAQLFTQLEEDVLNGVFLFNLTEVRQEPIFINNGAAKLKVYLAEFDSKVQHVSAIAWISDIHAITSIVLPLDMFPPGDKAVLDPIQISNLAKAHIHSCKLSTI
jgi:hypothetical protein